MPSSLESRAFSYPEVGATRGLLPAGYHYVRRSAGLGSGRPVFDAAVQRLMTWQAQKGAGLRVEPGAPVAAPGVDVLLGFGFGPLRVPVPCRVVYVVEEDARRGFAYGTLAGHPESGEEAFMVTIDPEGRVAVEIVAFSRPATWLTRFAGPAGRFVQRRTTDRYIRALAS
jgi:uncharacterized protein (UPF0548 family)